MGTFFLIKIEVKINYPQINFWFDNLTVCGRLPSKTRQYKKASDCALPLESVLKAEEQKK